MAHDGTPVDQRELGTPAIIRITNNPTAHVFYGRTHDHSTMGIQTGGVQVSTLFDPNPATEAGLSTLEVIANGIPSAPVAVTIW